MPGIEFRSAEWTEEDRARSAACFPGSLYGDVTMLSVEGILEFEAALGADDEEALHLALERNPYLLQYVVPQSGHHGIWAFPKRMIKTPSVTGSAGLIPDFLIATRSSLGYYWHIIELKKANVQFANAKGDGYSTTGHKGLAQCAAYYAHFKDYIESVRTNVGVPDIIVPKAAILVIGDATEETPAQNRCRREFCDLTDRVIVASYDRIRSHARSDTSHLL